jgi:hypothetical protein
MSHRESHAKGGRDSLAGVIAFVIVLCLPVLAVYGLVWLWNAF